MCAMALHDSVLLIRDYENIRKILRDIYIYGCFTRDDFIEMGISGRKYDNERRRISAYLPDKFIQKRRVNKKVLLYCSYHIEDSEKNYLSGTFRNKSFTALDVMSFFFVQQLLAERKEMTASEILDALPNYNTKVVFTKDNLRVKLNELVDKGYIKIRKEGRMVFYSLIEDIWKNFTNDELYDLSLYLKFLKNVSPLEVPYYFLEEKLYLYMKCERNLEINNEKIFGFKHNHFFDSLDNDVLLDILRGCKKGCSLSIQIQEQESISVFPVIVIHDNTYGRQYLYCFDDSNNRQRVIRLDKIISVKVEKAMNPKERSIVDAMKSFIKECWCTSGINEELKELIIEFRFDEQKEAYILRRIEQEGHGGKITKKMDGVYEYKIKLRDPDEMIPWIRSFGERAKVISSKDKNTRKIIANDWKKAVMNYESIR